MLSTIIKCNETSVCLKKRLHTYLFLFIAVIFIVISLFIFYFNIFTPHKQITELIQLKIERHNTRIENYFKNTAAQGIQFSRQVAGEIEKTLCEKSALFEDVADNHELIAALETNTYTLLYDVLRIADCSGSFIILDTTVNTKLSNRKNSRAGTCLILSNINIPNKSIIPQVLWTRGIHNIGHTKGIIFHNRWQLEFDISRIPFYNAVLQNAVKDLNECYYYSPAFPLYGTGEKIILLCVPIVGKSGQVYGMCGFEIRSSLFKQLHAEAGANLERFIGFVAQKEGGSIRIGAGLEFGTKGDYAASSGNCALTVTQRSGLNQYRLTGGNGTEARDFIGLDREIFLSPLAAKLNTASWVTVCMIPKEDYDYRLYYSYFKLISFCVTFFAITVFLTYYITKRYHFPIAQAFLGIKNKTLHKTYITEIDDLLEFMAANDAVHPDTHNDVDMSAFYEFTENLKKLTRTENVIYNLYVEGLSASQIAEKLFVSINTIKSHNKKIYGKLNVTSLKELLVYAQMIKERA